MADRPQLGDTPAGRAMAKNPKKAPAAPKGASPSRWQKLKQTVENVATGGAYDAVSNPPWQKNIKN